MSTLFSSKGILISLGVLALGFVGVVTTCQTRSIQYERTEVGEVSHKPFGDLLERYVTESLNVNYQEWKQNEEDMNALDQYLSKMTSASPKSKPNLFPNKQHKLAYWINLYNALMIDTVLEQYPIKSVKDISVSVASSVVEGMGIFREYKFDVAGEKLSFHDIEHNIIRAEFQEPRIHFAINCASASCPPIRKEAYRPDDLDQQLERATVEFINNGQSVQVKHENNQVRLSQIFNWYETDYLEYLKKQKDVQNPDVLTYILQYANDELASDLRKAKNDGYSLSYIPYDWSLNDAVKN